MFFFTCRLSFVLVTGYLYSHKQRLTHININQKYKLLNQDIFLTKEIQKSCSVANWLSQSVAVDALNTCEENCYELLQMTSVPGPRLPQLVALVNTLAPEYKVELESEEYKVTESCLYSPRDLCHCSHVYVCPQH